MTIYLNLFFPQLDLIQASSLLFLTLLLVIIFILLIIIGTSCHNWL
ncbi:sporulation protein YjcZ [Vibrio splendidus]